MLRTARLLPHEWAFDIGLRRGPFPVHAADLLSGLLIVTRAGLAPAGNDEHVSGLVTSSRHRTFRLLDAQH